VADDEPWPAVLSATLAARSEDRRVEVLNCGVAGYETEQEVAQLEERIGAFDPDLVLLGFFMNDTVLPNAVIQQPDGLSSRWIKILAPSRKPQLLPWLRRHLRTVDLGADWLFRRLVMRRWIGERELLFADDFVGWRRAQAAILRAREVVEGRGGRFVLLLVPLLMTEGDEILTTSPYRKVSAFCRAQDIRYYDPEPLFAGMEVDRMRVHPRDLHSTAEGHRIIALGLADWLQEQGLLEPRR
jgi:hypothetical protein